MTDPQEDPTWQEILDAAWEALTEEHRSEEPTQLDMASLAAEWVRRIRYEDGVE